MMLQRLTAELLRPSIATYPALYGVRCPRTRCGSGAVVVAEVVTAIDVRVPLRHVLAYAFSPRRNASSSSLCALRSSARIAVAGPSRSKGLALLLKSPPDGRTSGRGSGKETAMMCCGGWRGILARWRSSSCSDAASAEAKVRRQRVACACGDSVRGSATLAADLVGCDRPPRRNNAVLDCAGRDPSRPLDAGIVVGAPRRDRPRLRSPASGTSASAASQRDPHDVVDCRHADDRGSAATSSPAAATKASTSAPAPTTTHDSEITHNKAREPLPARRRGQHDLGQRPARRVCRGDVRQTLEPQRVHRQRRRRPADPAARRVRDNVFTGNRLTGVGFVLQAYRTRSAAGRRRATDRMHWRHGPRRRDLLPLRRRVAPTRPTACGSTASQSVTRRSRVASRRPATPSRWCARHCDARRYDAVHLAAPAPHLEAPSRSARRRWCRPRAPPVRAAPARPSSRSRRAHVAHSWNANVRPSAPGTHTCAASSSWRA